jgi:hypothetical protein
VVLVRARAALAAAGTLRAAGIYEIVVLAGQGRLLAVPVVIPLYRFAPTRDIRPCEIIRSRLIPDPPGHDRPLEPAQTGRPVT